jgi:hypothetical protein
MPKTRNQFPPLPRQGLPRAGQQIYLGTQRGLVAAAHKTTYSSVYRICSTISPFCPLQRVSLEEALLHVWRSYRGHITNVKPTLEAAVDASSYRIRHDYMSLYYKPIACIPPYYLTMSIGNRYL